MKRKLFIPVLMFTAAIAVCSCKGKEKKEGDKPAETTSATTTTTTPAEESLVPAIDTATLKDEASILAAMQKVVDARIADDKKKKEDPSYSGNYLELTKLYTAVLKASTAYSKTITDPAAAVEFGKKVSAIQEKMYAK